MHPDLDDSQVEVVKAVRKQLLQLQNQVQGEREGEGVRER